MGLRKPGPTTPSRSSKDWFRMAVPERLRAKVGKREIKFSLGTADPAQAKVRQAREQAKWPAHFIDLEREVEEETAQQALAGVTATAPLSS